MCNSLQTLQHPEQGEETVTGACLILDYDVSFYFLTVTVLDVCEGGSEGHEKNTLCSYSWCLVQERY